MRPFPAALFLLSCLVSAPALGAQEAQPVMTDGSAFQIGMPSSVQQPPLKTGTAQIRGKIVSSDTASAVRRATVRLNGPEGSARQTTTDGEGRFEFRELPAGRFGLWVEKSGYLSAQYGQRRPSGSGRTIVLADGQALDKADLVMTRASAIAGRVLDEFGEPVTDATVTAMRWAWMNGRRSLQPAGRMATTNDLGQFRLFGLKAGDYYVSATLRDTTGMGMGVSMAVMTAAPPGGALPGGAPPSGATTPSSGYAPTYFPGTINPADAQKITIAAGQDAPNTDFALVSARLASIAGFVIDSAGKPVEGTMVEAAARSAEAAFSPEAGSSAPTMRNGAFRLSGIPPGDYVLRSQPLQITTTGAGDMMTFTARVGGEAEIGSVAVTVAGENLSNVVIATSKAATASGQVSFDGGAKLPSLAQLQISARPAGTGARAMEFPDGSGTIGADGSFAMRGLSGTRHIRVEGLPKEWMLKSVTANGVDVTDTGIDFKGGETQAGIEVVLTSKVNGISGSVKGPSGAPVSDYTVILFSDDPQRWTLPNTRYVITGYPNENGRFEISGVPEGGYYAAATDDMLPDDWTAPDPDLLDRLKATATKVTLTEGSTKVLELKLSDLQ
jgi:protocatechuate 3,4-dioxygenase beta subunit